MNVLFTLDSIQHAFWKKKNQVSWTKLKIKVPSEAPNVKEERPQGNRNFYKEDIRFHTICKKKSPFEAFGRFYGRHKREDIVGVVCVCVYAMQ